MDKYFKEDHNSIRLWKSFLADYPAHFHEAIEVVFVLSGTATAQCNGIAYSLHSGSIFLACPNMIHAYKDRSQDYCHIVLIVDPGKLNEITQRKLAKSVSDYPVWQDTNKKSRVWQLIEIANDIQTDVTEDSLTLLLSTIVSIILENISLRKSTESKQSIRIVLEYCRTHFQEPISLKHLAETLHFSESYISHSFSKEIHISLPDYINGLRLHEAVRMLRNTNKSITEISIQSGFPTTRTFNRVFMKQYGISPTKFRKNPKYK